MIHDAKKLHLLNLDQASPKARVRFLAELEAARKRALRQQRALFEADPRVVRERGGNRHERRRRATLERRGLLSRKRLPEYARP